MKFTKTAKILIASGATLLAGALFFGRKAKASQLQSYTLKASNNGGFYKIITNHDRVYDYKFENGQWFTRKKGTSNWIDMKASLSSEKYKLAVSRLEQYL